MRKCNVCGSDLVICEVDKATNIAWLACPKFLDGEDEHTSYSVPLTEEIEKEFLRQ